MHTHIYTQSTYISYIFPDESFLMVHTKCVGRYKAAAEVEKSPPPHLDKTQPWRQLQASRTPMEASPRLGPWLHAGERRATAARDTAAIAAEQGTSSLSEDAKRCERNCNLLAHRRKRAGYKYFKAEHRFLSPTLGGIWEGKADVRFAAKRVVCASDRANPGLPHRCCSLLLPVFLNIGSTLRPHPWLYLQLRIHNVAVEAVFHPQLSCGQPPGSPA